MCVCVCEGEAVVEGGVCVSERCIQVIFCPLHYMI